MAAINKRTTESKFVSCFADSKPAVDITFRDVLLSRPTNNYMVGVDNFSLTSTTLSMLEPSTGDYEPLIRIVRNRGPDAYNNAQTLDQNLVTANHQLNTISVPDVGFNMKVSTGETILSIQQLIHRLNELASQVNIFLNSGQAETAGDFAINYTHGDGETTVHLKFSVHADGRLKITGTRAFWACFSIEVPNPQYQFGIYGDRKSNHDNPLGLRRYLTLHPITGTATFNKIRVNSNKVDISVPELNTAPNREHNSRTIFGATPLVLQVDFAPQLSAGEIQTIHDHANAFSRSTISYTTNASVFSTLERRCALELGCSLPIKNSPMIDHQKETPDFVLGRWIWKSDQVVESSDAGMDRRYHGRLPISTEYQGAKDRITYHELQAQAKIQTLRLKLFARVRSFSSNEQWSMRVIELPTSSTDWWHARLHFVSKD